MNPTDSTSTLLKELHDYASPALVVSVRWPAVLLHGKRLERSRQDLLCGCFHPLLSARLAMRYSLLRPGGTRAEETNPLVFSDKLDQLPESNINVHTVHRGAFDKRGAKRLGEVPPFSLAHSSQSSQVALMSDPVHLFPPRPSGEELALLETITHGA